MQEIKSASGRTPYESLMLGLELSGPHCGVLVDRRTNKPFIMGGIRRLYGSTSGLVWTLATPETGRHARAVLHAAKDGLRSLFETEGYTVVGNMVDRRNDAAIRWVQHLGFEFFEFNAPAGVNREPFHLFRMTREQFDHLYNKEKGGRNSSHV